MERKERVRGVERKERVRGDYVDNRMERKLTGMERKRE